MGLREKPAFIGGGSRRQFLGGSAAAALGAWSAGSTFGAAIVAAQGRRAAAHAPSLDSLKALDPKDEACWKVVRREFNILDGLTFMNTGTLGPMPRPVFDANVRYLRAISEAPHAMPS